MNQASELHRNLHALDRASLVATLLQVQRRFARYFCYLRAMF